MKKAQRKKERKKETNHWPKIRAEKGKKGIHTKVPASTKLNCDWVPSELHPSLSFFGSQCVFIGLA
jgi:hypothetical protein